MRFAPVLAAVAGLFLAGSAIAAPVPDDRGTGVSAKFPPESIVKIVDSLGLTGKKTSDGTPSEYVVFAAYQIVSTVPQLAQGIVNGAAMVLGVNVAQLSQQLGYPGPPKPKRDVPVKTVTANKAAEDFLSCIAAGKQQDQCWTQVTISHRTGPITDQTNYVDCLTKFGTPANCQFLIPTIAPAPVPVAVTVADPPKSDAPKGDN